MLQISLWDLHNDMISPVSQGVCFGTRTVDGKVCIGDTSLRRYIPKYVKPMRNRNNITYVCVTCIIAMLLQSDINKWRLSQSAKLDKLYINSAWTILPQGSKHDSCIQWNHA